MWRKTHVLGIIQLFDRTLQRHGIKMKSYVAVQEKLLVLIYVMRKKKEGYQPDRNIHYSGEHEQASSSLLYLYDPYFRIKQELGN